MNLTQRQNENKHAVRSNLFTPAVLQLHQFPQDEVISWQLYKGEKERRERRSPAEDLLRVWHKTAATSLKRWNQYVKKKKKKSANSIKTISLSASS